MAGLAINVGANTTLPGFRAPIAADGSFEYVPIPERKPTDRPLPTYDDLGVPIEIDPSLRDTPVHLDPTFAEYPCCTGYTYGDEHGVKATPISRLDIEEFLFFYATLETATDDPPPWMPPRWGAYLIGHHCLAEPPVTDAHETGLTPAERDRYAENAHLKRASLDARVLVRGDPDRSCLYDTAVPLSAPTGGSDPGSLVRTHSADSGKGPWWRRPLRFDDVGPIFSAREQQHR